MHAELESQRAVPLVASIVQPYRSRTVKMSSFGDFALLRNSALSNGDKLCRRDECEQDSPFQTATCNQANNDENNDPNARCASLRKTGGEKSAHSPEERVTKFNDIWDPAFGLQNSLPARDRGVSSPLAPRHLSNFKTPTKNTKAKALTSTASKVKSIKRSFFQSAITTEEKRQSRNLNMNGERDELFDLTQNLALLVEEEFGEVEECQTVERKTPNFTNIINYDKSNPCYTSLRKARGDESAAIIEELSSENESLKKKVDLLLSERYERYSLKSAFGDLQSSLDSKTKEARKLEEKLHRTEARMTDLQDSIKHIQMELDLERKESQKSLDPIDNMMIQGNNLSTGANVHERSRTAVEDKEKRQIENAKEPTSAYDTSTSEIHRGFDMADPFERGSVTTLEDDKNNVFMSLADAGASKRDLEAELIEMKELIQTLNCEKADFGQKINNITESNSTLLEKLESIKAENNQLLIWSDNVVKDNDSLMKKMKDAKFELESKKVELSNLETEKDAMVQQLKTIGDQVTAVIEQHIDQEKQLKTDLAKLNEAIQTLLYEKSEAIHNLISITAQNSLLVEEIEEATRNLSKVKSEKASVEAELQERMQTLQSELEAAHIKLTQLETETSTEREEATHNLPDVQSQKNADEAELHERVETLQKELNLAQTKNIQFESDVPTEQEETARYLQNADIQNDWNSTRAPPRDSLDTEATIPLPDDVQAIYDNANAQRIATRESYCDDSDHFSISSFDIGFDHHGSSSNYNHECSDDGSLGQTGNEESEGVEHYQQLLHQLRKLRVNNDGIVLHGNNVDESVHIEVPCSTLAVPNEVIATVNKKHNSLQESNLQNSHPKGRRTRASFMTNPTASASTQSKDVCIDLTKDSLIELSDQVRVLLDTKDMFGDFREEWHYGTVASVELDKKSSLSDYKIKVTFDDLVEHTFPYPDKDVERLHDTAEDSQHKVYPDTLFTGDCVDCFCQDGGFNGAWYRGRIANITCDGDRCDIIYYENQYYESNVPAKKSKIRLIRRDTSGDWLIGKLVRLPCDDYGNYCTGTVAEFEEERNVDDSNSGRVARVTFSDGSIKSVNFDEAAKAAFAHLLEDYPVDNRMMWPDSTPPSMAKPSRHRRKTKGTKSKGKDLKHLDASKKTSRVEKTKIEADEKLTAPSNLERKSGLSIWVQNGNTQHPAYELIDTSNSSSDCEFIWVEWLSNGEIERVQSHQVTRVLPRRSRRKTARYI